MVLCCKDCGEGVSEPVKSKKKEASLKAKTSTSREKDDKIVFFADCNHLAFDLEDLLRASAEVFGKGVFGTTYRAALDDATTVVVKRLKDVAVGKKEFEQHMEVVGKIKHENVDPIRAYYYSKNEKLVLSDYYQQGSVSSMLHGKRGEGSGSSLDWASRLRIAIGTARGIAHIHAQPGNLVHGNIKASNIFLNSQGYGCVADIGLATLMRSVPLADSRVTGYRAPEVTDTRKATQSSDVYSFGVVLLELLTGKSPLYASDGEQVVDLVRWVKSVVKEEWTAEVFDVELWKYSNVEEEMVGMLHIGITCAVKKPHQRPQMSEVVKMMEGICPEKRSEVSTPTVCAT
ncbi:probable inactive receptor kinase At4g23740 [Vicia villosa]|uniref:probable inactive receptor kinase At4g23740 n=1 Tax=Vicia villosa TaxID=3911 RepID=UPI00273C4CE5|nr:probable inactive receptor kinase At4g23740 [Vicia villosa]